VKKDVSRAIMVLLTDGRANVPMYVSMNDKEVPESAIDKKKGGISRAYLNDEVLAIAKVIGDTLDIDFLCIDTEDRFVGTGISEQLCRAARGTYHKLATASLSGSVEVAQIARQRLKESRDV
jgi:magnesium chelatase subunit D